MNSHDIHMWSNQIIVKFNFCYIFKWTSFDPSLMDQSPILLSWIRTPFHYLNVDWVESISQKGDSCICVDFSLNLSLSCTLATWKSCALWEISWMLEVQWLTFGERRSRAVWCTKHGGPDAYIVDVLSQFAIASFLLRRVNETGKLLPSTQPVEGMQWVYIREKTANPQYTELHSNIPNVDTLERDS